MTDQVQLRIAASMNNKGVALIITKRPNEGLKELKKAIRILKSAINEGDSENMMLNNDGEQNNNTTHYSDDSSHLSTVPITRTSNTSTTTSDNNISTTSACLYIYDRAIIFRNVATPPPSANILIGSVLYNMALIHHVVSFETSSCCSANLKKSVHLYETALHCCRVATSTTSLSSSSSSYYTATIDYLRLICENNIAQIYYETAQYELLKTSVARLSFCIATNSSPSTNAINDYQRQEELHRLMPREFFRDITLNLMFLVLPCAAGAA